MLLFCNFSQDDSNINKEEEVLINKEEYDPEEQKLEIDEKINPEISESFEIFQNLFKEESKNTFPNFESSNDYYDKNNNKFAENLFIYSFFYFFPVLIVSYLLFSYCKSFYEKSKSKKSSSPSTIENSREAERSSNEQVVPFVQENLPQPIQSYQFITKTLIIEQIDSAQHFRIRTINRFFLEENTIDKTVEEYCELKDYCDIKYLLDCVLCDLQKTNTKLNFVNALNLKEYFTKESIEDACSLLRLLDQKQTKILAIKFVLKINSNGTVVAPNERNFSTSYAVEKPSDGKDYKWKVFLEKSKSSEK